MTVPLPDTCCVPAAAWGRRVCFKSIVPDAYCPRVISFQFIWRHTLKTHALCPFFCHKSRFASQSDKGTEAEVRKRLESYWLTLQEKRGLVVDPMHFYHEPEVRWMVSG